VPIIAKVERPAASDNLTEILKVAQGVMVARGDLGLELPYEQVPRVQKEIIRAARTMGRPRLRCEWQSPGGEKPRQHRKDIQRYGETHREHRPR
jgi:hypothetical protein